MEPARTPPSTAPVPVPASELPVPVSELGSGATGRLLAVGGARAFRRRLMELGLLPGTTVRVVRRAPMGGIVELEVRGCRISLRLIEARDLTVEQE